LKLQKFTPKKDDLDHREGWNNKNDLNENLADPTTFFNIINDSLNNGMSGSL